jgi:tetratricopeptide (TPR) repeat protein
MTVGINPEKTGYSPAANLQFPGSSKQSATSSPEAPPTVASTAPFKTGEGIRLNPQNVATHYNRGLSHGGLGRYQRAIEDFGEALHLEPELAVLHAIRAIAYTILGRGIEARQDVAQAVELGLDPGAIESAIEDLGK